MHAIVVEDNETNFLLVEAILKRDGWNVEQAHSLGRFRERLGQARFDLVILDVSLPDGDGLEALHTLRGQTKNLPPVFVMTAHAFGEFRERAYQAGAHGFFTKPFSLVEFQHSVRNLVAEHSSPPAAIPPG